MAASDSQAACTGSGGEEQQRCADNEDEQEQEWPGYDRDVTTKAISELYRTLQRMYLPSGNLEYPPSGGWTWPDDINFSPAKTKAVVDLTRHMPKLIRPQKWSSLQVYEATEAVDFSFSWAKEGATIELDPSLSLTTLPSHVLMIGQTYGRNGHHLFIDTERGTVTVRDFQVGPTTFTELAQDLQDLDDTIVRVDEDGKERTQEWRSYPTYSIVDFFENVLRKFEQLDLAPYFNGVVHFGEQVDDDEIKQNFQDCGWPSESFDREDCRQRVKAYFAA